MHLLQGSSGDGKVPLCLAHELAHGYWTGRMTERLLGWNGTARVVVPSSSWKLFAECRVDSFSRPVELAPRLLAANISTLVFIGDSRMRRAYYRASAILGGEEVDAMATWSGEAEARRKHEVEKGRCLKSLPRNASVVSSKRRCFGACSCSSEAGGVRTYFLWQTDWHTPQTATAWQELLRLAGVGAGAPHQRGEVVLLFSTGLKHAWELQERSLPLLVAQLPGLLAQLAALPPRVRPILQLGSAVQDQLDQQDDYQAAQDGLLKAALADMDAALRPALLDLRMLTQQRVDFYDRNHPAGGSVDVQLQALVHISLHWEQVVRAGRGLKYAQAGSRELRPYFGPAAPKSASLRVRH